MEICDNGANTTQGQSPHHSLHRPQLNNKRGTVQPLALFLIAPLHDKLTENALASEGTREHILWEGDRVVGDPHKNHSDRSDAAASAFTVVCVFSATNSARGSVSRRRTRGDRPPLRVSHARRTPLGGSHCYNCGVMRRERRKLRDQREDGFSQRKERVSRIKDFDSALHLNRERGASLFENKVGA